MEWTTKRLSCDLYDLYSELSLFSKTLVISFAMALAFQHILPLPSNTITQVHARLIKFEQVLKLRAATLILRMQPMQMSSTVAWIGIQV